MRINNFAITKISVAMIFFLFTLITPVISQAGFTGKNLATRGVSPVYVEGYLIYDSVNNRFTSNLTVKRGNRFGNIINNARILLDGIQLRINRNGIYTGAVLVSGRKNVMGTSRPGVFGRQSSPFSKKNNGFQSNRNNLNLSIWIGGRTIASVSDNINAVGSIRVLPVYKTGIDVGEPVTVYWDRPRGYRNQAELLVVNANNGNLILKRIMRSDRYVIGPKKLPPRKVVVFKVRMFVKRLNLAGNVTRGSYVDLYSGGEFKVNTHR